MEPTERGFVTLVTGLPRSGTSMMMRMLESGGMPVLIDAQRAADDDNPRGYYEYAPVKRTRESTDWLESAQGRAVKIVYRLLYDLPADRTYRVLLMERRLPEVYASQETMLRRLGQDGGGMDEATFVRTFTAEFRRTQGWLRAQAAFATLPVSYNEVMEDPVGPIDAINRFLGGGLDTAAMRGVVDPALYRQRALQ